MSSVILEQLKRYIDVADNYKSKRDLYFFLKDYAFSRAWNLLSKEQGNVDETQRKWYEKLVVDYKQERANENPTHRMTKQEYMDFLEFFYGGIDFDNANLYMINISRDLIEPLTSFGELDDLSLRRRKIFSLKFYSGLL